jgi:SNF2 family DNA or RNA helicase
MSTSYIQNSSATATKEVQDIGDEIQEQLFETLNSLHIKRLKTEVLKNMPEKTEKVVFCELSEIQKRIYEHILDLPDVLCLRGANVPCDCGVSTKLLCYTLEFWLF